MNLVFSAKETWLHKVNPTMKLAVLLFMCISIMFIDSLSTLIYIAGFIFILYLLFTGHPIKRILLLTLPFLFIFVCSSTSLIFFGKGEHILFQWGIIKISEESIYKGMTVGFRGIIFAELGLIFALTTRPVSLFYSLMQQAKVPPKYAYGFMAGLRMLPIMMEEFQTIRNAMTIRGVEQEKGLSSISFKLKVYSVPLLSQSIRRAHRIAIAMEAKRFSSAQSRTYYYIQGFSKFDIVFVMYFVVMFTSIILY